MLIFRSCSSFRRTCKSVALAARVMPSAYCTRPLIILFYIIWLVCAAAKGLISTIPITFVFCTCVAAYAIYDRRAHYMNVFYDLKHIHRTVTVEGDMLIVDVQESGNRYDCRLDEITIASVTDWGMMLYFPQCAVLILSEDGEGYTDFAAWVKPFSGERTKKIRRSLLYPLILDIILLCISFYLLAILFI